MKSLIVIFLMVLGNFVSGQSLLDIGKYYDDYDNIQLEDFNGILASANYNQDSSNIEIVLINTTEEISILYSGLFKDWALEQPFTHKVDTVKKQLILSLTPTFGYFRIQNPSKNFSLSTHHNWYRFIDIQQMELITIALEHHFFKSQSESFYWAIPYTNPDSYESILELPFLNKSEHSYNELFVEIALYSNIKFLDNSNPVSDLYSGRNEFRTIRIRVK